MSTYRGRRGDYRGLFAGIVSFEGLDDLKLSRDIVARVIADDCAAGRPPGPGDWLVEEYLDLEDRIAGIRLHARELCAASA